MTCEETKSLLSDYVDRDLDRRRAEAVEAHLDRCNHCRSDLDRLEALRTAARRLGAAVPPRRDLWPQIARRIADQDKIARRRIWAAAAALVVTLGLAGWLASRQGGDGLRAPSSPRHSPARSTILVAADLAHLEDRAFAPRRDLLVTLERRRETLSPQLAAAVDADVAALYQAIGEIRLALENRPDSSRLNLLLADRYQQEADLLRRLQRL